MPSYEVCVREVVSHTLTVKAPDEFYAAEQAIAEISGWTTQPDCETLSNYDDGSEYEVTSTGWLEDDDEEEEDTDA